MNSRSGRRAAVALLALMLAVPAGSLPRAQDSEGVTTARTGEAQLRGRILGADGSRVVGATIVAYHLSSESVFRSAPTDGSGEFSIENLPYGYYDLAVQNADGLFVADQVINLPPSGKTTLTMTLSPGGTDESAPRGFLGADEPPTGVAQVGRKGSKKSFWGRPAGLAIIAGAGVAAIVALSSGSDDERPASPSGAE